MEVALKLVYNVALLFILMLPGIIVKKCHLSTDGFGKGLSNLILYVAQPALVFLAYVRPYDQKIFFNSIYVLGLSIVAHVIFSVVTLSFFKKAPDAKRRMLRFATIFSNAAFMGIPLIAAVLGTEATLYATIYNITFNIFLWSLGVKICTDDRDVNENGLDDYDENKELAKETKHKKGASPLKAFYHPVTIAAAIGLVFFFLPIHDSIPAIVNDTFDRLAALVAPVSMIVIGLRLADMKFKGMFADKYMYIFLALRHVVLPLAVLGVVKLCGLFLPLTEAVELVVVIMASAPAATSATMFAEMYDCDADYVSKLVTVSTLLSIATMPAILLLV